MRTSHFSRILALFLAAQPPLWIGNVAQAQVFQVPGSPPAVTVGDSAAAAPIQAPVAPGDLERVRSDLRDLVATPAGPAIDGPIDPDRYVCGAGDVLELNAWGAQNFRLRIVVDLEGRAFIPRVGPFTLAGKTLAQARRTMRDAFARQFPRLSFDLTLVEPRRFVVHVSDDVVHPGSYPARAVDRVAAIVERAGWGPGASRRRIEIKRRDGSFVRADLLLFERTGDTAYNPYLLDGDVVRVPFEELAATVTGGVKRPGRYELVGNRDLAELVEVAGGLAPEATGRLPLSLVRRTERDVPQHTVIDRTADGALPALAVRNGDEVRIPTISEVQPGVTISGAVAGAAGPDDPGATRRLPFASGDSVRTLLERVGGLGPQADLRNAYVIHAGVAMPVDLHALVVLRDLSADRPVSVSDTLVVPFERRNVAVEGAVFRPGPYPYNPSLGVEEYLSLAGGRNRFAQDLEHVRVVTPDGKMQAFQPGQKVTAGSSVIAPERNFTRSEIVQLVFGAAGILLSGAAVIISARR